MTLPVYRAQPSLAWHFGIAAVVPDATAAAVAESTPLPHRLGPVCEPCWLAYGEVWSTRECECRRSS